MSVSQTDYWPNILRTQRLPEYVALLEQYTGKQGVIKQLEAQQTELWQHALTQLAVSTHPSIGELRQACNQNLALFNQIVIDTIGTFDWEYLINQLRQHIPTSVLHGQFLRRECLETMVQHCPPVTAIAAAGYSSIEAYLQKESVYELLAAARFTESPEWMRQYLQQYHDLTPLDFSNQPMQFLLLEPQRWWKYAAPFAAKKKHNFSHLKEAGVVFWYPNESYRTDHTQLHRLVLMLLHYIYEVHFYATWFERYLFSLHGIGKYFVDTLLGDTLVCAVDRHHVPILQQYHLKQAHPNPCVYEPHTMSEALHWGKAIGTLAALISQHPNYPRVAFWEKCYTVIQPLDGKFVTLNVMDVLLSQDEWLLYHAREDIWNAIFAGFTSYEQLEQTILYYFSSKQIDLTALHHTL